MSIPGYRATALVALVLCVLFSGYIKAADSATARPRAALVIGNAAYSAVNPLKNPAYDAHDMCDALTELGYAASCFVDVKDAREFKARIQDFAASLKPKSEVLFYYAGHAVQLKGENYLVPTSAKLRVEADVARETVSLNYIMTQLLQAKHYLNIVILDACRSNPWSGNQQHAMTSGLAPITAIPRGTMVMYGTATNDVSDDGEGRNGTLTKNLLASIKMPGLTVDEFFKRVSEGVQSDSAAAVGHTQTPALYTNFTGEFCFAGCIDKVARAELEKMRKANEEQLEQAKREKAELEARNRAAEARLAASMTSLNCDQSVVNDTSQCFNAASDKTQQAVITTLKQRGMNVELSNDILASLNSQNPDNKTLTDILTVTASVREIPVTHHTVVTLTANQKSLLHDEYHTWSSVLLIPIPTSKQYREVVRKDVDIVDPQFYRDLFTAIERNLRAASNSDSTETAAPASPASPATDVPAEKPVADTSAAPPEEPPPSATPAEAPIPQTGGHQRSFAATLDRTQEALLRTLVMQGFILDAPAANDGNMWWVGSGPSERSEGQPLSATRWIQDPKDTQYSIRVGLSIQAAPDAAGSVVRIDATRTRVLHDSQHDWQFLPVPHPTSGSLHYKDVVKEDGAVGDSAFYDGLFAGIDDNLRGNTSVPADRSRTISSPAARTLSITIDALAQLNFTHLHPDEKLHFVTASSRISKHNSDKTERTAHLVDVTVLVVPASEGSSMLLVSAKSRDTYSAVQAMYRQMSGRQLKSFLASAGESSVYFYPEGTTREGEADPAVYKTLLASIERKLAR